MTKEFRQKLITRLRWIFLIALWSSTACYWAFQFGKKEGKKEQIDLINQPGVMITGHLADDIRLILIRQKMPMGNLTKNRVEVDTSAISGLQTKRLLSQGLGSHGYYEEITVWSVTNSSDSPLPLSRSELTNLPDGVRFGDVIEIDYLIQPTPKR